MYICITIPNLNIYVLLITYQRNVLSDAIKFSIPLLNNIKDVLLIPNMLIYKTETSNL